MLSGAGAPRAPRWVRLWVAITALLWLNVALAAQGTHEPPRKAGARVTHRAVQHAPPVRPHAGKTALRTHPKAHAKPKTRAASSRHAQRRVEQRVSRESRHVRQLRHRQVQRGPKQAHGRGAARATRKLRQPHQLRPKATPIALRPSQTLLPRCGYTPASISLLRSRAVYVVDDRTHAVLIAKNADQVRPIASISKLMTAVVALDAHRALAGRLTVIPADRDFDKFTGSRLKVGSVLSRRDMLHIALMSSENRAAAALSRDYAGGRPRFVAAMNAKARALGMLHTSFVNPTGLSPHNVSTARDLARLVAAADRYALIRTFSTDHSQIVAPGHGRLVYHNSNPLVRAGSTPIVLQKTGFINEAGHCVVMRMRIHGHPVTVVLLGAPGPRDHIRRRAAHPPLAVVLAALTQRCLRGRLCLH
ncbi:serine hydrolase [Paraburkholderia flava]|uniref:serine hydrolase n=1 Tax=Paraburkholderia flava TaxID=2547393 RepID=UPI003B82FC14